MHLELAENIDLVLLDQVVVLVCHPAPESALDLMALCLNMWEVREER
jgi:hypothetical protein